MGVQMKNKLYFLLFILYVLMIGFILYLNGVFAGEIISFENLLINMTFLLIIGIMFIISAVSFARLNRCTDALTDTAEKMEKEYEKSGECLWDHYQDREKVFGDEVLDGLFHKYQKRMRGLRKGKGFTDTCDLEEYIGEDVLEELGMSHFNSGVSGTLTGIGILGTFIGLSMGLSSFSGDDIYTIADNVGPLLDGMKVAFHTSIYGIFFSLVFNFIYRSIMADAYEKLASFMDVFKECVMPRPVSEEEGSNAMLIYQANMANSLKTLTDLMKGNAAQQIKGVEQIVDQFMTQMSGAMGTEFRKLGNALNEVCEVERVYAANHRHMEEAQIALLESNNTIQNALKSMLEEQERFAKDLREQSGKLSATCDELSDEISAQLYTFNKMGEAYEK